MIHARPALTRQESQSSSVRSSAAVVAAPAPVRRGRVKHSPGRSTKHSESFRGGVTVPSGNDVSAKLVDRIAQCAALQPRRASSTPPKPAANRNNREESQRAQLLVESMKADLERTQLERDAFASALREEQAKALRRSVPPQPSAARSRVDLPEETAVQTDKFKIQYLRNRIATLHQQCEESASATIACVDRSAEVRALPCRPANLSDGNCVCLLSTESSINITARTLPHTMVRPATSVSFSCAQPRSRPTPPSTFANAWLPARKVEKAAADTFR